MAVKIRVSKAGYNAITETNPDNLVFSSDYNTLKYSLANGSITINIDTSNEGIYTETREITHGLGYKPFFKVYISPSFIAGAYLPTGYFQLIDAYANCAVKASVDDQKMYFTVTGRNTDVITQENQGGGGGLQGTYDDFFTLYNGSYNVGNTPANQGQCTGLVNVWASWLGLSHIWGDGKDIYANADSNEYDKIPNSANNSPIVGDIVCWNSNMGGGAGHVGVATGSGNANNFDCFEQNDPYGSNCHVKNYDYSNVQGWLRPKNQGSGGGSGTIFVHTPHHIQFSITFKYKIFKNSLGL